MKAIQQHHDRLPPQNLECERSVIASCVMDNRKIDDVVDQVDLRPDDFFRAAHDEVWSHLLRLHGRNAPVDIPSLADSLTLAGRFKDLGGNDFMTEIMESVPHSANALYYAGIVKERATSRRLIDVATAMLDDAYGQQASAADLLQTSEERIFAIGEQQATGNLYNQTDLVNEAAARFQQRIDGHVEGLEIGLELVDQLLCGVRPVQLIVVGARPGMGKTGFGTHVLSRVASSGGRGLMFSLEMGRNEVMERLACAMTGLDTQRVHLPRYMSPEDRQRVFLAFEEINSRWKLVIDDSSSRNMSQLAAAVRRTKRRGGVDIVVVDYLQLIDAKIHRNASRQEVVAETSRRLKITAGDLHVPFLVLCQLNRASEQREDKRPRLADLRESGAIEQDADVVMLLHRPDHYKPDDMPNQAQVIIAKNRNGPCDTAAVAFEKHCVRFSNLARQVEPTAPRPDDWTQRD